MNKIKPGTKLGRRSTTYNGKKIWVDVIYKTDEEGELEWNDGLNHATLPREQYKQVLAKYIKEQEVAELTGEKDEPEAESPRVRKVDPPDERLIEPDLEPVVEDVPEEPAENTTELSTRTKHKRKLPELKIRRKPLTDKEKDARRLDKKKIIIPLAVLGGVVLIAAVLLIISAAVNSSRNRPASPESQETAPVGTTTEAPSDTDTTTTEEATKEGKGYYVAVLSNDITIGSIITEADIEQQHISEADYKDISSIKYVTPSGDTYTGTVVEWASRDSVIGKMAVRNLSSGDVLLKEDATNNENAITGNMTVHLYAVISSDNSEELTIDLGQYILGGGTIEDILNSKGESLRGENKETETEAETEKETEIEETEERETKEKP